MNIFKILASGDGKVYEPSVSAFLGYLLDPNKEHGLKDYLLKAVFEKLRKENDISSLIINENIVNLTDNPKYKVDVELEEQVNINSGVPRDIDIVITIHKDDKLIFILCIENKISAKSVTNNQLNEQLEGIKNKYQESIQKDNTEIGFIYLTPESCPKCKEEYEKFKNFHNYIPSTHLSWNGDIYNLLVSMLEKESKGIIEPIFDYSKYTIKAFMNFIKTDFQSYKEEKDNVNKKDTTRFIFDSEDNLSRAKLALKVIAKYIAINSCTSIEEVTKVFGSNSVLTESDAKAKDNNSNKKSYYTKDDELITLPQPKGKIAVNSQVWVINKLDILRDIADKMNFKIEEVN